MQALVKTNKIQNFVSFKTSGGPLRRPRKRREKFVKKKEKKKRDTVFTKLSLLLERANALTPVGKRKFYFREGGGVPRGVTPQPKSQSNVKRDPSTGHDGWTATTATSTPEPGRGPAPKAGRDLCDRVSGTTVPHRPPGPSWASVRPVSTLYRSRSTPHRRPILFIFLPT